MTTHLATHVTARKAAIVLWTLTAAPAVLRYLMPAFTSPYGDVIESGAIGNATASSVVLWLIFAAIYVILMLPGTISLTLTRVAVPANALLLIWASAASREHNLATHDSFTEHNLSLTGHGITLTAAIIATIVVLHPAFGGEVIDAGSYGDEKRFLLRPPGITMIALIVPVWALTVVSVVTGPFLLMNFHWWPGVVALLIGIPTGLITLRALHQLACRWIVFVPRGIVIHDRMGIGYALPIPRKTIASIGPATASVNPASSDYLNASASDPSSASASDPSIQEPNPTALTTDLTAQALGLALHIRLTEPLTGTTGTSGTLTRSLTGTLAGNSEALSSSDTLLISPSRPAAVISTAQRRGIKIH